MATGPRLVNKQFNSPIGLYSAQNVQDTLNKQTQLLANGAVGIDFHNPNTSKPGNLANSAVLRMLEEEEQRQRIHQSPSLKRVAWPPPSDSETNGHHEPASQEAPVYSQDGPTPNSVSQSNAQANNIARPAPLKPFGQSAPVKPVGQSVQSPGVAPVQPSAQSPGILNSPHPFTPTKVQSPLSFVSAKIQSPQTQSPNPLFPSGPRSFQPTGQSPRGWAPVHSPTPFQPLSQAQQQALSQPPSQGQPQYQAQVQPQYQAQVQQQPQGQPQYQAQVQQQPQGQPQYQAQVPQQTQGQPQYQAQVQPQSQAQPQYQAQPTEAFRPVAAPFEPPPTIINLRKEAPISQKPSPVYASQPATTTLRGGSNMRGDQKWPPAEVKAAAVAENQARVELAKGPACRPRKVAKDYSGFFARHALNSTYPGYRAPPGTQHYDDNTGISAL